MDKFKLSEKFLEQYKDKKPPFGFNGLGEITYLRTYSRIKPEDGTNEQWWETCKRVVDGTYNMQKKHIDEHGCGWNAYRAQRSAQEMYERMFSMKFLPPGRGLWAMGSPITEERNLYAALNNCLASNVKILTRLGFKEIGSIAGSSQTVLTKNGKWVEAEIKSFGIQKLSKITLQRQGIVKEIFATSDHIWFAKSKSEINHNRGFKEYNTSELREGYRLQYLFGECPLNFSPQGIQHGICFGDGTYDHLYLIGEKDRELVKWFPLNKQEFAKEKNAIRIAHVPSHFKELPFINYDRKYLFGWLMGYFAADGSVSNGQVTISSSKKSNLEFVQDVCGICGIGTYDIRLSSTSSNFSDERELWQLTFMPDTLSDDFFLIESHRKKFKQDPVKRNWVVLNVEETDIEKEVFCAVVPETESFVIEGNILTHNCSFVSTTNLKEDLSKPFIFMMDMSMLGVGVGFDTLGAGQIVVEGPNKKRTVEKFSVPDTREGWVESVKMLLDAYFLGINDVEFDYSLVRKKGEPIKGFGGTSSGPDPLIELHKEIRKVLNKEIGQPIGITAIVDIMNLIGVCVVAGNVRRSAQIVFGDPNSDEYLKLKDYRWDDSKKSYVGSSKHRSDYGWTSNNSIFAILGQNYKKVADQTAHNGEPGYIWMENVRGFSRMNNGPDWKDKRAAGANPCFSGDTLIAVADGRHAVSIKDLSDKGLDIPVYTANEMGQIEIKWARHPRKTGENKQLLKIVLDDGSSIRTTLNHDFVLSDGSFKKASELKIDDRLMVRSKWKGKNWNKKYSQDYWWISGAARRKGGVTAEHRIIAEFFGNKLIQESEIVHHRDYNGLNNSANNLEIISTEEHYKIHNISGTANPVFKMSEETKKGWKKKLSLSTTNYNRKRKQTPELRRAIGKATSKRCESKEYRKFLGSKIALGMTDDVISKMLIARKKAIVEKYPPIVIEPNDVNTFLTNKRAGRYNYNVLVRKIDPITNEEFLVPIGKRGSVCKTQESAFKLQAIKATKTKHAIANDNYLKLEKWFKEYALENKILPSCSEISKESNNLFGRGVRMHSNLHSISSVVHFVSTVLNSNLSSPILVSKRHYRYGNYRKKLSSEMVNSDGFVFNHKIVSVELDKIEDVYCLTVDDTHKVCVITPTNPTLQSKEKFNLIVTGQCSEQSLESWEMCCLVETFLNNHDDLEDYLRTLKFAYLYAKTVTLGKTHWPETNRVMLRNRRIGCSMSGIVQFLGKHGIHKFKILCEKGYDEIQKWDEQYSEWFAIPKSIKTNSIKPSGTVSLLAGATPGLHYPESRFYIRRIRLSDNSQLIKPLEKAGYYIEPAKKETNTVIVSIPVDVGEGIRSVKEVSMWEQLALVAFIQRHWADNQVSATIRFDPKTEANQIEQALNFYQYQLKGISFLPNLEKGAYAQMPYEEIDEKTYHEMTKNLKKPKFDVIKGEEVEIDKFCNNDVCEIPLEKK